MKDAMNSSPHWFLPIFHFRGFRWRIRFRWIGGRILRFERATDVYPEGVVHRVCVGGFLFVAMVDKPRFAPPTVVTVAASKRS